LCLEAEVPRTRELTTSSTGGLSLYIGLFLWPLLGPEKHLFIFDRILSAFVYVYSKGLCSTKGFVVSRKKIKPAENILRKKCVVLQVNDVVVSLRLVVFLSKVQGPH
jgi:hypothetical protein